MPKNFPKTAKSYVKAHAAMDWLGETSYVAQPSEEYYSVYIDGKLFISSSGKSWFGRIGDAKNALRNAIGTMMAYDYDEFEDWAEREAAEKEAWKVFYNSPRCVITKGTPNFKENK